jgi:hypothetical protein
MDKKAKKLASDSSMLWNSANTESYKFFKITSITLAAIATSGDGLDEHFFNVTLAETSCEKADILKTSSSIKIPEHECKTAAENDQQDENAQTLLRCAFILQVRASKPRGSRHHLVLVKPCELVEDTCVLDALTDTISQDGSTQVDLTVDVHMKNEAFEAVKLWNRKHAQESVHFFKLKCLRSAWKLEIDEAFEYRFNLTMVESECSKEAMFAEDSSGDLELHDVDKCLEAANKVTCVIFVKIFRDENEENENELLDEKCFNHD